MIAMRQNLLHRINFRDLGGYPAFQGKQVKADHLFRSGEMADLSSKEIEYLRSLGLAWICDLRSEEEQKHKPNPVIDGIVNMSNPAIGGAAAVQNVEQLLSAWKSSEPSGDPLQQVYKQFVTDAQSRQAFQRLIRSILESEGRPVLWHCTAGKDRTGFATAIVLLLLDVPFETIMSDYTKSALYRQEANRKLMEQIGQAVHDSAQLTFIQSLLGVKPEYLLASIEEMNRVYGSVDHYLLEGLGVTAEERKQLQSWYLTEQEAVV